MISSLYWIEIVPIWYRIWLPCHSSYYRYSYKIERRINMGFPPGDFLIMFSYMTNALDNGSVVLLIHDFSDIFLIVLRVYADYKVYFIIYIFIIRKKLKFSWIYGLYLLLSLGFIQDLYSFPLVAFILLHNYFWNKNMNI